MAKVAQKQQKRRREITEAVLPLLMTQDFESISVSDICSAADISIGSFYHYFSSKADILIGLLMLIDSDMESRVFPLLTSGDERENLSRFAHGWAEHVAANGIERSRLITSARPTYMDESGTKRVTTRKLEEIMARGQEKGQITSAMDAQELASMFLLAMRGVTVDWSRMNGEYDAVEKMDKFIGLFLTALRP
ncbi:MAG: TetR/AcrR family transcriptional regulator [Oscillospiraceae bacterium]|nr:TetR/AcrR family transcriptional regulator [Oscillospiraceae bacterium]MCD8065581.1 TetR/AcrR family transcriptional regulator [Oscillospiraceae bacterium]